MTIHICSKKQALKDLQESTTSVHYIPCTIHGDGDANVKKYFETYMSTDKNEDKSNSFRGHPIKGKAFTVPDGYSGYVLQESKKPLAEQTEREFTVKNHFTSFTFWNWDKDPSQNDAFGQAMDWLEIADAVHGSIETE